MQQEFPLSFELKPTMRQKMEELHRRSLEILSPYFGINGHVNPLRIIFARKGTDGFLRYDKKRNMFMGINPDLLPPLDRELACVHESAHWLHMNARPQEYKRTSYEYNEAIATVPTILFFQKEGRWDELRTLFQWQYQKGDFWIKKDLAVMKMLEENMLDVQRLLSQPCENSTDIVAQLEKEEMRIEHRFKRTRRAAES